MLLCVFFVHGVLVIVCAVTTTNEKKNRALTAESIFQLFILHVFVLTSIKYFIAILCEEGDFDITVWYDVVGIRVSIQSRNKIGKLMQLGTCLF